MFGIIGIVFLLVCVFGSFVVGGGNMKPFIHAAPIEGWCIFGSAIGGMLIGNSADVVKAAMAWHRVATPSVAERRYVDALEIACAALAKLEGE